ncbi:MAG: hypothetical protein HON94_01195, partial [Methylococcales bacterium]|nr:hypothetical protein [Methylococcales bacterium]
MTKKDEITIQEINQLLGVDESDVKEEVGVIDQDSFDELLMIVDSEEDD